jgi:predicted dehydrogenase
LAEKTGLEYDVPWATSPARIIALTSPDAATIASPHPTHMENALICFRHGLHVFCDKPMAARVAEADRMIAAAKKARRTLAVMFQFRAAIATRRAKELIDKGALGTINRISMFHSSYRSNAYFKASPWRGTWKGEGGGVLMSQTSHYLDTLIHLAGQMPLSVIGRCATKGHDIETEDFADALLEFRDGAVGHVYASTGEAPGFSWFEIGGDKGRILIGEDYKRLRFAQLKQDSRRFTRENREEYAQPEVRWHEIDLTPRRGEIVHHAACIHDFVNAVRLGRKPMITGVSARQGLELTNAIVLSAFRGEPVKLPVSRREYEKLFDFLCCHGGGRPVQDSIRAWRRSR